MIRWWKVTETALVMFCSEVLSDDLHVSHVSLCVYVIRCLCFHSCCYKNTCVRVDEAWGCPAHKNKSNVEMKWFFIFFDIQQENFFCGWLKTHLIGADTHLQRLEDGSAVGGQLGVGGLAEELGEGSDGVQFVCWNLERKKKTKNVASNKHLRPQPPLPRSVFSSLLTSENFPSPNHCSHLMPWLACRLPVARHVTTMPGHQEKPLIFPHTSSPMPKPLLSWKSGGRESEDEVNPSLPTK